MTSKFDHSRWNIAIKNVKESDGLEHHKCRDATKCNCGFDDALYLLLDEGKIMSKVGGYHENVVNLQGISASVENEKIIQVNNHLYKQ